MIARSVGILTKPRVGRPKNRGSTLAGGDGDFTVRQISSTRAGTTHALIQGRRPILPQGEKRQGHKTRAEVKNRWSYTYTPQYALIYMIWC